MKIKINIFTKINGNFENSNKLEIYTDVLSEKEEEVLKKCSIYFEKKFNSKTVIYISDFIYYNVELDSVNEGIYIKNTKNYYEVLNEDNYEILGIKNYFNLVISKEGVKLEVLLLKKEREI